MTRRPFLHVGGPLALGAGLAVIGPYGTYDQLGLAARLIYWCAIVAANWLQIVVLTRLARRLLPPPGWGPAAPVAVAACAASLPAAAEVILLEHWFRPGAMAMAGISFAELYFLVLVITLPGALLVFRLVEDRPPPSPPPSPSAPPPPPPAHPPPGRRPGFLDRLPPRLGRQLLCLRTEDHYLRVHTTLGDDLILMRMTDAEAELADHDGIRVHRSWWVARAAVARCERRPGGKLVLILSNGIEVPVSRNGLGAVRAAGWPVPT